MAGIVFSLHSGPELKYDGVVSFCLVCETEAIDTEFLRSYRLGHCLAAGDIF